MNFISDPFMGGITKFQAPIMGGITKSNFKGSENWHLIKCNEFCGVSREGGITKSHPA